MQVLVTLNSGQGGNLGPNFTLSANTGTVTPNTATLTQLLAGIYVIVDNAAISITITSVGTCTNSLVLNLYSTTTTAPTTTTTTTAPTTTTTASPVVRISTDYTILCGGGGNIVSDIIYGNGTNICNSSNVASITFYTLYPGTYYLYSALLGYVEYYKISGVGSSLMNRVGACISCPTTTTTTTTAAPTTTTTAAPTTTTTAAPTTTTTAAPTTTTTTTTAAPTTSTTTSPEGFCYTANRYECIGGSCVFVEALNINNPVELNIPRYYFDSVNGYVFRIEELINCAGGGQLITNMSGVGTLSCNTLCPAAPTTTEAPTTTTTTTDAPTTSTTTSSEGFCYTANRYECIGGSCVFVEALNINNPVELNIPRYYFDSVNGYVFRIEELINCAGGGQLITNMSGVGTLSCNTLCP